MKSTGLANFAFAAAGNLPAVAVLWLARHELPSTPWAIAAALLTCLSFYLAAVGPIYAILVTAHGPRIGTWRPIGPALMTQCTGDGPVDLHVQFNCYPRIGERDGNRRRLEVMERLLVSVGQLAENASIGSSTSFRVRSAILEPRTMIALGFVDRGRVSKWERVQDLIGAYSLWFLWVVGRRMPRRAETKAWASINWELSNAEALNVSALDERLARVRRLIAVSAR